MAHARSDRARSRFGDGYPSAVRAHQRGLGAQAIAATEGEPKHHDRRVRYVERHGTQMSHARWRAALMRARVAHRARQTVCRPLSLSPGSRYFVVGRHMHNALRVLARYIDGNGSVARWVYRDVRERA